MREGDVIARLGGEEFIALVPGSVPEAAIAAERVRTAFEAAGQVVAGERMNATVSIGAADTLAAGCNIDRLMSRADVALYDAKKRGRNCVVCAPQETVAGAGANAAAGPRVAAPPVPSAA
jgi:diguanylate cyclase (GGDEF)-like protein